MLDGTTDVSGRMVHGRQQAFFIPTQVLYSVAELGVADELGMKGPRTAQELAMSLGVDEKRLYRVLRSAVQMGVFAAIKPKEAGGAVGCKNNRLSACLREYHPNCLREMILYFTEHSNPAFDELAWAVRTNGHAWKKTHDGLSQFDWLQLHPKEEQLFCKAMQQVDGLGTHAMATDYGWNGHSRIVDIGGAYGSFMAHLLSVNRKPLGIIERAKEIWAENPEWSTLTPRMEFVAGDFFNAETLPKAADGDVFVMRLILHDWDDSDCVRILSSLCTAMGSAKARLLIVETTLGGGAEFLDPLFRRALLDLHMMVVHDSAERTVPEWKDILQKASFSFGRHIPTRSVFSIVEAFPA
ncbi:S-adenosyl-L-methionine-dependent methyltransferase [Coccomyxa subellipsoidea C-169]|uniref:S-adenosyl-L-methionine-dependent methyltransferase n=1 Tax=Coccomyxa subellipsoidea (strain C-169) TaxID=574566 RepID=I0YP04_COCSC|nr:S-adenosyl-L-methionine-dependent methyltransferase [Coccomyxa subellipsoidea C-169]EIE20123.1 S-adenosyl-L-methionine-dependent methyltransferase [Coccomyxa subellipsoidea C-169]|eukprot:XP_005644667.1 S-adenosyl-L-methionine-dependent methyltransferase [Coccomyxa subellipsoidea C-169]